MHWKSISNDPNSPKLIEERKSAVQRAKAAPVRDRLAYLEQLAQGKSVLDIGVVDHLTGQETSENWLHGRLAAKAAKILGVDILPEAVEVLQKQGYNVRLQNVIESPLAEQFDLIVAGEVIEHLGYPEGLLHAARKMLKSGGRLVLTTPNPYYLARVRDNLRYGFGWDSVDHVTLLFPFGMAELCERAGLKLVSWRGLLAEPPPTIFGKIKMALLKLLSLSKESFCNALIYEAIIE